MHSDDTSTSAAIERVRSLGEPFKKELIDRVLPTSSLLDAGGMWGVHGAYALHASLRGTPRVVVMDTLKTPEFAAWSAKTPGVEFVQGDMNDPGVFGSFARVETAVCFEVLMHQAAPLWTLYGLTSAATRTVVLSVSVLPESSFPFPNCGVFLPGMPESHQAALHPAPGNPVFKVFSKEPESARSHSEWHWGLTGSLITSWMKYFGWSPEAEWRRPFLDRWEWWQAIFHPDASTRL
jgi:hypothetical protein